MNRINRHVPNFCEGVEESTAEFSTLEELFAVPWIAQWKEGWDGDVFYQFSFSETRNSNPNHRNSGPGVLMAEYNNGTKWYVVGYFKGMEGIENLPKWNPKKDGI